MASEDIGKCRSHVADHDQCRARNLAVGGFARRGTGTGAGFGPYVRRAEANAVYTAFKAAKTAKETADPRSARSHPQRADQTDETTGLWRRLYLYPDDPDGFSGQNYFPDGMPRPRFYDPKGEGHEGKTKQRLEYWAQLREKKQQQRGSRHDFMVCDPGQQ